jgi:hypothetical protein
MFNLGILACSKTELDKASFNWLGWILWRFRVVSWIESLFAKDDHELHELERAKQALNFSSAPNG